MASLEEGNGFSGEEKRVGGNSAVREEEKISVSPPEGGPAPETEESEQELCFKNGAIRSLDIIFRLWWISLVALGVFFVLAVVSLVPCIVAAALKNKALFAFLMLPTGVWIFLGLGCSISCGLAAYVLLYRYWKFIPEEEAATTPAKAVGYCFIPIFNLYWNFVAYVKLSRTLDRLLERPKSACTKIAEIYWVLFLVSSVGGFLVLFLVFFFPEAGDSPFLRLGNSLNLPVAALFIAMVCFLQQSLREYLRKMPVSRWKDNPRCSSAPIVLGIFVFVLYFTVIIGAGVVSAVREAHTKKRDNVTCTAKVKSPAAKKSPAASEAQKEVKAPAAKKAPEAKKEAKAPETKSAAPSGGNAAVRNGTSREAEGKKLD
ncbi:MAG: hypothetical protein J6331_05105 [Lentisphaeria bacterium]|nr:hypothetical protein [Lentisphaeria bacterium]